MAAPFVPALLGRRSGKNPPPNVSDSDSPTSVAISEMVLHLLGLPTPDFEPPKSPGIQLERAVAAHLLSELEVLAPAERWEVRRSDNSLKSFAQYRHLADLEDAIKDDESGSLRIAVGGDYLFRPDVTVGRHRDPDPPVLHASVSCKWTLRSDRAQNARTEARGLLRHRKGRAPHITVVTAEPLPSRLASLSLGTGDLDAVYHVYFEELRTAVHSVGTENERKALDALVGGDRLRDYNSLPLVLAHD